MDLGTVRHTRRLPNPIADEPRRTVIPMPRREPEFGGWGVRL